MQEIVGDLQDRQRCGKSQEEQTLYSDLKPSDGQERGSGVEMDDVEENCGELVGHIVCASRRDWCSRDGRAEADH